MRHLSSFDHFISQVDQNLKTLSGSLMATERAIPTSQQTIAPELSKAEKKHAARLMRVNHTGEVCAQALYLGQACIARVEAIKMELKQCAAEEKDHLYWCQERLKQLDSRVSYLNFFWFWASFILGIVVGMLGDRISLGFLAETEHQVEAHLTKHLKILPIHDHVSRDIVYQMRLDEISHAQTAERCGASNLPNLFKFTMKKVSKIMTNLTYYI